MSPIDDAPPQGDELEVLVETEVTEDGISFTAEELFRGWSSISVVRPLDAVSGSFTLEVTAQRPWALQPGSPIRVRMGGEDIVRGFVDTFEARTSKRGRKVRVTGRDRTADLVDCAALNEPGQWNWLSLIGIVEAIAEPFGITVVGVTGDTSSDVVLQLQEPVKKFKLQSGETAWSAIERLLRSRGLLGYTDGEGSLILARPGDRRSTVPLIEGGPNGNILAASYSWSNRDRFQTYTVRSQAPGDDLGWGDTVAGIVGEARDKGVGRYRPWLQNGESSLTPEAAADSAAWQASFRAARAQTVEVAVRDWRRAPGEALWRVAEIVPIEIPSLDLQLDMLINRVTFTRSKRRGTRTNLQLTRPDSYLPKADLPTIGELDSALELFGWDVPS